MFRRSKWVTAVAVVLLGAMLLSGCGKNKAPGDTSANTNTGFNADELTPAQTAAYRVMSRHQLYSEEYVVKSMKVLLTDDFAAYMAPAVDIGAWEEAKDTKAVVLAGLGFEEYDGAPLTLVFLVDGTNQVIDKTEYYSYSKLLEEAAREMAADSEQVTEEKRNLAEISVAAEEYLASTEGLEALAEETQTGIAKDADYLWSKACVALTEQSPEYAQYVEYLRQAELSQRKIDALEAADGSEELLETEEAILNNKAQLYSLHLGVEGELETLKTENGEELAPLMAEVETRKKQNPEYYYDTEYLKLCLQNDLLNTYDAIMRQIEVYDHVLEASDEALQSRDPAERLYILQLSSARENLWVDKINALKVHAACLLNYDAFKAENADELKTLDDEIAAVKAAQGEGYLDSVDYMKIEVKYADLIKNRDAHESAVSESLKAADAAWEADQAEIAQLESEEAGRLAELAREKTISETWKYFTEGDFETVSEYEAEKNQWAELGPDFIAYQNENLRYFKEPSVSSNDDKMKYDPNDKNYASHDYDGDGYMNTQEFQDAFNDRVSEMLEEIGY